MSQKTYLIKDFFKGYDPIEAAIKPEESNTFKNYGDLARSKMFKSFKDKYQITQIFINFLFIFCISVTLLMLIYPKMKILSYKANDRLVPNRRNILIISAFIAVAFLLYSN